MKKTVLLDLDGVLAHYEKWQGIDTIGDPLPGAVDFTKNLSQLCRVVIYTTRTKAFLGVPMGGSSDPDRRPVEELVAIVKAWLDRHGFAYDEIFSGQGKPFGAAIIDDRAVSCQPMKYTHAYSQALREVWRLCQLCQDTPPVSKLLEQSEEA